MGRLFFTLLLIWSVLSAALLDTWFYSDLISFYQCQICRINSDLLNVKNCSVTLSVVIAPCWVLYSVVIKYVSFLHFVLYENSCFVLFIDFFVLRVATLYLAFNIIYDLIYGVESVFSVFFSIFRKKTSKSFGISNIVLIFAVQYRGIEQLVARRAHNPEAGGSSPPPATKKRSKYCGCAFLFKNKSRGRVEIGRQARLRIWCREAYGFDSLRPHIKSLLIIWFRGIYCLYS